MKTGERVEKKLAGSGHAKGAAQFFFRVPLAAPGPVFFRVPLAGVPAGPRGSGFDLLLKPNPNETLQE